MKRAAILDFFIKLPANLILIFLKTVKSTMKLITTRQNKFIDLHMNQILIIVVNYHQIMLTTDSVLLHKNSIANSTSEGA